MGIILQHLNRSGKPLKDLQKVFFCAEESDQKQFMGSLSEDLFTAQPNISLWYPEGTADGWTTEEQDSYLSDLQEMNLFVIPVTNRFLNTENRARTLEFRVAAEHHIPVLPVLQEQGLEEAFNAVCGNLQCLNKLDPDPTALPYQEKLKVFLDTVLLKDETIEKIRNAFAAYIFLSYRKKDRKYAQEVMRLIHKNPFTRDIAIWYDEFLTPGEDFNESIKTAFKKSDLFSMVVTPSLLEKPNYVMTTEYPMAIEAGKTILPVMAVPTDKDELEKCYPEIPERIGSEMENADRIEALIRQALEVKQNDDPEHKFFMGLAYLSGIDLEKDYEKAEALITDAAGNGIAEACLKLVTMYETGQGVERDYEQGAAWQQRYADLLEKKIREGSDEKDLGYTWLRACNTAGSKWMQLYQYDKAWVMFRKASDAGMAEKTDKEVIAQISTCMLAAKTAGNQKHYAEAEAFLERARELAGDLMTFMRSDVKKKEHTEKSELLRLMYKADIARQLGDLKNRAKKRNEAIALYKEAIPVYEEFFSKAKEWKAGSQSGIANNCINLYMSLGEAIYRRDKTSKENRAEAEPFFLKNLRMTKEYREENPAFERELENTAVSRGALIEIYTIDGRLDEAEAMALEFREMAEDLYAREESVKAERILVAAYVTSAELEKKKGDADTAVKWMEKVISLEEELGGRLGRKNVAPQLKVYYKDILKRLKEKQDWDLHREYTEKMENFVLECFPDDWAAISDLAFAYCQKKDAYGLAKSYGYYDRCLELNPANETMKKNLGITEKQLNDAIRELLKEQNIHELQKVYDHFQAMSEQSPGKEGLARIRDRAEDYLAVALSKQEDISVKEKACVYFQDLAERHPEVAGHANNLRITRANIALVWYKKAQAGDRAAAQRAYEMYSQLGEAYPDRDYRKNAAYVKKYFMGSGTEEKKQPEASELRYSTRGDADPQGKPRVFYTAHPEEYDKYYDGIREQILGRQNCALFRLDPEAAPGQIQDYELLLSQMQLFVVPVTAKLLTAPNRAMDIDIPIAEKNHIPILPLVQESGLDEKFNEKFGDIQYLDQSDTDPTAISYDEKLDKYLNGVIIGDDLADVIRGTFRSYIFLSYRKKDRRHANRLMRLIHGICEFRDVAVWYDEYLVPGEVWRSAIQDAFDKSSLFVLTVTPNVLEPGNFVKEQEYRLARKRFLEAHKDCSSDSAPDETTDRFEIVPVEMYELEKGDRRTDRQKLSEDYPGIPELNDEHETEKVSSALLDALGKIGTKTDDDSPIRRFLIGLAYLSGIDVEVDRERAVKLLEGSAEELYENTPPVSEVSTAMIGKLVSMYETGEGGMERDYLKAVKWREKITEIYMKTLEADNTGFSPLNRALGLAGALRDCAAAYDRLKMMDKAEEKLRQMIQYTDRFRIQYPILPIFDGEYCRAYIMFGRLEKEKGELQLAEEYCRKGIEEAEYLLEKNTGNGQEKAYLKRIAAGGYFVLADLAGETGDSRTAEESLARYRSLTEGLDQRTDNSRYRQANSLMLEALNAQRKGDLKKAEETYLRSLSISEALAEETGSAEARGYVYKACVNLGNVEKIKNPKKAEELYQKAYAICDALLEETHTAECRKDLAICCRNYADLLNMKRELKKAEEYCRKALETYEAASQEERTPEFRKDVLMCCQYLILIMNSKGNRAGQKEYLLKSTELCEETVRENPAAQEGILLFETYCGLAEMEGTNPEEADGYYRKAFALFRDVLPETEKTNIYGKMEKCCSQLSDYATEQHQPLEAKEYERMKLEILEKQAEKSSDPAIRVKQAGCCMNLGVLERMNGDENAAKEYYLRGVDACREVDKNRDDVKNVLAGLYCNLGMVLSDEENLQKAMRLWNELAVKYPQIPLFRQREQTAADALKQISVKNRKSLFSRFGRKR